MAGTLSSQWVSYPGNPWVPRKPTSTPSLVQGAPALGIPNALQSAPNTTAHELGHICSLWHLTGAHDITNLMFSNDNNLADATGAPLAAIGTDLFGWQAQLVRASRHVSYF